MTANRPSGHAHRLIASTVTEMGNELYEVMMSDNLWYSIWKKRNPGLTDKQLRTRFVAKNQTVLLPQARAILAKMISTTTDEHLKQTIYEALCLDATLVRGRIH